MRELFFIALSAVVINNLVFTYFLGICPFLGVSRRLDMAFGMGAAVTFVMTITGTLTFLINKYVLLPFGLGILQYIVFIFFIAAAVQLVEMYVRKYFEGLYEAFGVFLPMITTNCAILGACLFIWLKGYTQLIEAMVYSFCGGLGFTLAIVIMAGLREELELADVPRPLRGAPITLFIAAILAMAFTGFAGIGTSQ